MVLRHWNVSIPGYRLIDFRLHFMIHYEDSVGNEPNDVIDMFPYEAAYFNHDEIKSCKMV